MNELASRIVGRLLREKRALVERLSAAMRSTFPEAVAERLDWRCTFMDAACVAHIGIHSPAHVELVRSQAEDHLAHRFDLLGSGPVVVAHGIACAGLEGCRFPPAEKVQPDAQGRWLEGRINRANLAESRRIWSLIDPHHRPIDWQLDFRSGFRWSERTWSGDIRFARHPGQDVKLPWELARMQHLPVLALAANYSREGAPGFQPGQVYGDEIRNQILDFIATNPPGFGVNWSCPMDVGIRIANILLACDLLHAAGHAFDEPSRAILAASTRSHARHLARNLEWAPRFRGNHYLANVVGLLFCAAYLPRDDESDLWLHFAAAELISEAAYQFDDDGGNFEGSTCYHRLSGELLVWGLALLDGLSGTDRCQAFAATRSWRGPRPPARRLAPISMHAAGGSPRTGPVPPWCRDRVAGIARLTRSATRPDGCVTQFGDNDSGRFFSLAGIEQVRSAGDPASVCWSLDHAGLSNLCAGFLGAPPTSVEGEFVAGLSRRQPAEVHAIEPDPTFTRGGDTEWTALQTLAGTCTDASRHRCEFVASCGLREGLGTTGFPGAGFYFLRSARLYLAIRCGPIGLAGLGSHDHCDQLAIELVIDGIDRIRDPGSYLYTPLPLRRNDYRSAMAHHVPRSSGRGPADLTLGLFDLRDASPGECLYFGSRGFVGRHAGLGGWVYRSIALEADRVVVIDFSPDGAALADPTPRPLPLSQGYGRLSADLCNVPPCDC